MKIIVHNSEDKPVTEIESDLVPRVDELIVIPGLGRAAVYSVKWIFTESGRLAHAILRAGYQP